MEQGLYGYKGRLFERAGRAGPGDGRIQAYGGDLLQGLVHQSPRYARLDLRARYLEPLLRSGAALGPQRRGRHD